MDRDDRSRAATVAWVSTDRPLNSTSIVAVALELLEANGLDAVTGASIAEQLGVTQPALYRHVDGMDDVWRGLGLVGRQRLAAALTDAAVGRSGPDAVAAVAHAWRDFARRNAALYAATDRYPCAGDAELEAAVDDVVAVLAMTLRAYRLDDEAAADAARLMRSFLHGFVHLELGDGHPLPTETDASFERIVDQLGSVLPVLVSADVRGATR